MVVDIVDEPVVGRLGAARFVEAAILDAVHNTVRP